MFCTHLRICNLGLGLLLALSSVSTRAESLTPDIRSGSVSSQWPGVGTVYIDLGGGAFETCTGTVIAPRWVLTAAHCAGGSHYSFLVGNDYTSPVATYDADQTFFDPSFDGSHLQNGHDLGLIHVVTDIPLLGFKLNSQPLASGVNGSHALAMGYGVTATNNNNTAKYIATLTIASYDSRLVYSNSISPAPSTCEGDSGGPLFVYDADGFPLILATTSYGDSATCSQTTVSAFDRVDADLAFITSHVGSGICLNGQSCDGILRDGFEPPL